jgi:mannosyltransferase
MKIIFDNIIFSLQKSGGISLYWYELINRFANNITSNKIFLNEKNINNLFSNKLDINDDNIIFLNTNILTRYRPINFNLKNEKFIFHSSYYRTLSNKLKNTNEVKIVVTVHDFTYERYSKGLKKLVHTWHKKKALKSADIIICISENTKKDLLYYYPCFSKKDIRVIYNGVSDNYKLIPRISENNKKRPYILFVGSRANYKNFDFVVKALKNNPFYDLFIVGNSLNNHEKKLLLKNLNKRWEVYTDINNDELNILYNNAFCLLYPSSYEGFGIPIVEAMKAGCPFIALKASSITEVAGKAGYLMDDLNYEQFNKGIEYVECNKEEIIKLGFIQSEKFSWDKCFKEIFNIYTELNQLLLIK